jgi:hypothetical protein
VNKKQKTISLILAAIAIWGYLIYVIYTKFFQVVDDSYYVDQVYNQPKTVEFQDDTFTLKLNYRDPFLSNSYTSSSINIGQSKPVENVSWPKIEFVGTIKNKDEEGEIAIVKVMEVEHFWRLNQKIGNLQLVNISQNKILVKNNKEKREFSKQ